MVVLDCESFESTLSSVARLYRTDTTRIVDLLHRLELVREYATTPRTGEYFDDFLKHRFESWVGEPVEPLTKVCWFHLTRVLGDETFSDGILPLHLVLDKIWKTLIEILGDSKARENLEGMRE